MRRRLLAALAIMPFVVGLAPGLGQAQSPAPATGATLAIDPVYAYRAVPGQVTASSAASARVKDTRLTAALPSREVVCRAV